MTRSHLAALLSLILATLALAGPSQAQGCPPGQPCEIAEGEYRFELPRNGGGAMPVIVHFHGAANSAAAVLRTRSIVDPALDRGYAFIALQGLVQPGRNFTNWSVRDGRRPMRDEAAFARAAVAHLGQYVPLDPERVYLTGFSRGASAIWDIACHDPAGFAGFSTVAGAFWDPLPEACAEPVRLSHYHGWEDATVPLEGRHFGRGDLIGQGDVYAGLRILRETAGLQTHLAQTTSRIGDMLCKSWADGDLSFCLHPGGHRPPDGWMAHAIDGFEGVPEDRAQR
ncbi:alpha/beta hydrolase family esterase [Pontivivens ytuae]|uniref:Polyhydroxybutyrate depolymerase n=1 Tax=Pontivivens ytuae TaxID=2789856 RepID=A0A7S9LV35_9RHOB|nr:polyhydroxybutyrate depolymerase [Pontivivens ytuae]QPH55708.1 polyhydroxybutyrate depolymerase [Pontivivens ytuae]